MTRKRRIQKPEGQTQQWHIARKRMRGEGVFYKEVKSEHLHANLTPTAKARLNELVALNKLSISEYLERWLKGVDGLFLPK